MLVSMPDEVRGQDGLVTPGKVASAADKLETLSSALQDARTLDVKVLSHIYQSGLYDFDPLDDGMGARYGMQSTSEYDRALKVYQTLRVVMEQLKIKLKLIYSSEAAVEEATELIETVDEMQIGSILEVDEARAKVANLRALQMQLDRNIAECKQSPFAADMQKLQQLYDTALSMNLHRLCVEKARITLQETRLKRTLAAAEKKGNIAELAAVRPLTLRLLTGVELT